MADRKESSKPRTGYGVIGEPDMQLMTGFGQDTDCQDITMS